MCQPARGARHLAAGRIDAELGRIAAQHGGQWLGGLPLRLTEIVGERVLGPPTEPEPFRSTRFRGLPH